MNDQTPAWSVRPAGEADYDELIRIFNAVFKKDKDRRTLEWKYLKNPHGPSVVWVAETGDQRIIGSLAFVPRRMLIEGREYITFLASDGMVFEEWQRQGIFVRLLHIMFESSWEKGAPLAIAFSGRRSVKGLIRTDWDEVGLVQELVLPLRGSYLFKGVIRRLSISAPLVAPVGDWILGQGRLKRHLRRNARIEVKPIERFDDALADMGMEVLKKRPVCLVRDRAFLNWRYVDNPTGRHRCFGAFKDSAPVGYMVMETEKGRSYIADLIAVDREAREDLLARAVMEGRKRGGEMLHIMALEGDEVDLHLRGLGFKCLPRMGLLPFMVKMGPAGADKKSVVVDSRGWYLAHGDKDAEHMTV